MMPIQNDLIESLAKEECINYETMEKINSYSSDDWIDAINNEQLDKNSKLRLIKLVKDNHAMLPVIARLSNQSSFGILVAREILSENRWQELTSIIEKSGMIDATDVRNKEIAIGNLVTDKRTLFFIFSIMFSKNFAKGIGGIIYDSEADVRQVALEHLASMSGELVKNSVINALDDTDEDVSSLARRILHEKYPEDAETILSDRGEELSQIRKSASDAKERFGSTIKNIPWISSISNAVSETRDKVTGWTSNFMKKSHD